MKNDPIETGLAGLDEVPLQTPEGRKQIEKALASKFNLIAAKAARVAADAQWAEIAPALASAFDRMMTAGNAADKGCVAKISIARALVRLEHDDAVLYLRGMKHVQMEPVWGGSEDRAAELRTVCAMGLVNSTARGKLSALVDLLVDGEWVARAGAARAIGAMGGECAAMVLKLKCLLGDGGSNRVDVLSECYQALLAADGAEGVPLVAEAAASGDDETSEVAILALGASRRPEAIERLKELFSRSASPKVRASILLSLATSRTEDAVNFLLDLLRSGSASACALSVNAMAVFRNDSKIRQDVKAAIDSRDDGAGVDAFQRAFVS